MGFNWKDIILYGYSIGSGPSVALASQPEYQCKGLILHSAICSGLRTALKNFPPNNKTSYYDLFPNCELL